MHPLAALIALIVGFLAGVVVNLLADYLPARRHYDLARRSPFSTVKPQRPEFGPRQPDRSAAPLVLWSATLAVALGRVPIAGRHTARRVVVEVGLAVVFLLLVAAYSGAIFLPFYLFYAACMAHVAVTDIEHRWIMSETTWVGIIAGLGEALIVGRIPIGDAIAGGLVGFVLMLALYLLGFVFAALVKGTSGRPVGRTVLGIGDVRFSAFAGVILGTGAIGPALLISILAGGVGALAFIVWKQARRGRYRRFSAIPYGPYLVIGAALTLYTPSVSFGILLGLIGAVRGG
jgi:prepilin signal peptidase PulO-like enzyme (type II secretory pathway)